MISFGRIHQDWANSQWFCTTVDFVEGEEFRISLDKHTYSSTNTSVVQLVEILHHPAQKFVLRLLWWKFEDASDLTPELLDVCGLGFGIAPRVFIVALDRLEGRVQHADPKLRLTEAEVLSSHRTNFRVGNTVVIPVHSQLTDRNGVQPTLLILGLHSDYDGRFSEPSGPEIQSYAGILEASLRSGKQSQWSSVDLLSLCLLPLPLLEASAMSRKTRQLRDDFIEISRYNKYADFALGAGFKYSEPTERRF